MSIEGDIEVLARTIWAEARNQGQEGMEAVASVVLNRVAARRWPNTIEAVVLQPFQFSVWNQNNFQRPLMLAVTERDPQYRQALAIAKRAVVDGTLEDRTGGADHFHHRSITPFWAREDKITARIGAHVFYKLG